MIDSLIFLGTSSAIPLPGKRNTSCLALLLRTGRAILVDCGEATQHQIMKCPQLKLPRIDYIFLTHLHGDHCYGLFGLLHTIGMSTSSTSSRFGGLNRVVHIIGPPGIFNLLRTVMSLTGGWEGYIVDLEVRELCRELYAEIRTIKGHEAKSTHITSPRCHGDKQTLIEEMICNNHRGTSTCISYDEITKNFTVKLNNGISVVASPLSHPIVTHGYTFMDPTPSPVIDMEKVRCLNLHPKFIGHLQKGKILKKHLIAKYNSREETCEENNDGKGDGNRNYYSHSLKGETMGADTEVPFLIRTGALSEVSNDSGKWRVVDESEFENSQQMKFSHNVHSPDEHYISIKNISSPNQKKPLKISVIQDTCESERAIDACMDCDVLVHECTYENSLKEIAVERGHSTAGMAGEFARRVNAKLLVLTHFSARYKTTEILVKEAQHEFGSLNVTAADDFMVLGKQGSF